MFGIDDAITAVTGLADTVVKRVWADATETEKARIDQVTRQLEAEYKLLLGQIETNKIEAKSESLFKSGWRPSIGWVCGFSLAYAAILEPMARFAAKVAFNYTGEFPVIDTSITMQILLGMLGLAGARTFEKSKGLTK